uniref:Uncharacterized protein n=1 Tax=Chrysotila carterae TaxID=13221 RepID=A0A7S4B6S2_CHRCT|mmetsp:Transcript_17364/g.36784  ORF Transcript_17364/g.36784 Transcript_17364/m.36784 type:complete len:141 (-) Transcript_17364:226-648(-)
MLLRHPAQKLVNSPAGKQFLCTICAAWVSQSLGFHEAVTASTLGRGAPRSRLFFLQLRDNKLPRRPADLAALDADRGRVIVSSPRLELVLLPAHEALAVHAATSVLVEDKTGGSVTSRRFSSARTSIELPAACPFATPVR